MYDLNDSPYLAAWMPYRGKFTFLVRFLLLVVIIYVANMISSLPAAIAGVVVGWNDILRLTEDIVSGAVAPDNLFAVYDEIAAVASSHPAVVAVNLIGQLATFAALLLYTVLVEKRSAASVGVVGGAKRVTLQSLSGVGIGAVLMAVSFGICVATGAVNIVGVYNNGWWLPLFLVGFLANALAEELLYRGFFLSVFLRPGRGPWMGIIVVTIFSALPYIGTGVNAFVLINAVLMGLLLSVLALRTGSVWLTTCLSAVWNVMLISVFGDVGGIPTIWRLIPVEGRDLTSGGSHGLEGGLVVTLVLLVALVLAIFLPSWKKTCRPRVEIHFAN